MNNIMNFNNKKYLNNKYNPLAPKRIDLFNEISKEIDGAFNEIFGSNFFTGLNKHKGYPLMDAIRTGDKLILQYTVPGVSKNNVKAEITEDESGRLLTVSGILNDLYVYDENSYQIRELSKQEFRRVIRLPEDVIEEDPVVIMENGILTLTFKLKKLEENKPKTKKLNIL
jgi:HSP20 family molecular chaperone IbpA